MSPSFQHRLVRLPVVTAFFANITASSFFGCWPTLTYHDGFVLSSLFFPASSSRIFVSFSIASSTPDPLHFLASSAPRSSITLLQSFVSPHLFDHPSAHSSPSLLLPLSLRDGFSTSPSERRWPPQPQCDAGSCKSSPRCFGSLSPADLMAYSLPSFEHLTHRGHSFRRMYSLSCVELFCRLSQPWGSSSSITRSTNKASSPIGASSLTLPISVCSLSFCTSSRPS